VFSVRPISMVRIFSRNAATAAHLAKRLGKALPKVEFHVCPDIASATRDADVICTATTATSPLIHGHDLKERVHINAVGAYRPDMCELSPEVVAEASVVAVDHAPAARAEAGDLLQAASAGRFAMHDAVELGALLSHPRRVGAGWTVFKSVGISAQDWALAKIAVERSEGKEVPNVSLK
ncbi:MAG: ornithine cyclodeaminase family protein, partial [Candidatus Dormibacteraeota bacterium]|nr:ornithine cyclodeaminase family protein [Candidatus Dormibacteraeota bacterium]